MKEGEDYFITEDPKSTDGADWAVIFKHPDYDQVVGRYSNIEILEQGTKLSFKFQPLHVPPESKDVTTMEFHDYIADVLGTIIKEHHEKRAMSYFSKETGEMLELDE